MEMICASPALKKVKKEIEDIAAKDRFSPILLMGETGVGKEIFAQHIHNIGCPDSPFVSVNVGGMNENLIASELFGYTRGAFTGANKDEPGLIVSARSGTLLLDEIGELPPPMQVVLLRVLQERKFLTIGGKKLVDAKARFIAATNKDLAYEVEKGTFRKDLFYRFTYTIVIPPLRDRTEDIIPLALYIAKKKLEEREIESRVMLSSPAMDLLKKYKWPGNVRELENTITRALIKAKIEDPIVLEADYFTLSGNAHSIDSYEIASVAPEGRESNLAKDPIEKSLETLKEDASKIRNGEPADDLIRNIKRTFHNFLAQAALCAEDPDEAYRLAGMKDRDTFNQALTLSLDEPMALSDGPVTRKETKIVPIADRWGGL